MRRTKHRPNHAAGRRQLHIEALEERQLLSITVNTLVDELDGSIADGDVSIRNALLAANPFETIEFDAALFAGGPATLHLTRGELRITKDVKIQGPGSQWLTIDAAGNDLTPGFQDGAGSRVFNINNNGPSNLDVQLSGLGIVGGDAAGDGGAIRSLEDLTLVDLYVAGNFAGGDGGGVFSSASLTLISSVLTGNRATGDGGGVQSSGPYLTIQSSVIQGNAATDGGGVAAQNLLGDWLTIESTISGNQATQRGGGVFSLAASAKIVNSQIDGNSASSGGGVYATGSQLQVKESNVAFNGASVDGGGLFVSGGTLAIVTSTLSGNFAQGRGGALYRAHGTLQVTGSTLYGNGADSGGAVFASDGNLTITSSTISTNSANSSGGGLRLAVGAGHSASISHTTITANVAGQSGLGAGGGIAGEIDSALSLTHTIVAGNLSFNDFGPDLFGQASAQYSLIGVNSGAFLVNGVGNVVGTQLAPVDPRLGPLTDNGGPTWTHALLAGSPAIDAGDPNVAGAPPFDQRGPDFNRILNGDAFGAPRIDIGSFEVRPGSIAGQKWNDLDADGTKDPDEPGLAGWTIYIDENANGTLDGLTSAVEPDDYPLGTPLNNVVSGATLSYSSAPGNNVLAAQGFASTGSLSFGLFDASSRLRIDFAMPTAEVRIDAVSDDSFDLGQLDAFDAAGNLLATYFTGGLGFGQVETMLISRPSPDIAFVLAGGREGELTGMDNFHFGTSERATVTDVNGNYSFAEVPLGQHIIAEVFQSGWEPTFPSSLSATLAEIGANSAAIAALVPTRFDFFEGATGNAIGDGGNDMYDGGNLLSTNRWGGIPYTNGSLALGDTYFGPGSEYFTAKYPGLFVMGASHIAIDSFAISGDNGADGDGTVDGQSFTTTVNGRLYTVFLKRVFNAGDPSINHLIMIPGDGAGVSRTFDGNTNSDFDSLSGLSSVNQIYYALVARAEGALLSTSDATSIANAFLGSLNLAGGSQNVVIESGTVVTGLDFGNHALPGAIQGQAWNDANGNGIHESGEMGLAGSTIYLDENQNGAYDAGLTTVVVASDVPYTVDPLEATSRLTVAGLGLIDDLNVTLDITHPWSSDLDVFLISPSGRRVELFTDVGGSSDNFFNTTLDDEAATPITFGTGPFTGSYRPEGLLSTLDGENPNGVWKLELVDDILFDASGILNGWSLTFVTAERSTTTDVNGNYAFANVPLGMHTVAQVLQPGSESTGPGSLSATLAEIGANSAAIAALVPTRFDFSEGATGNSIDDGGNDMYDGGNFLSTNRAGGIPYTNGTVALGDAFFGPGSEYFTAKYPGLFVMGASHIAIDSFAISGDNGADGDGTVDGQSFTTTVNGRLYTVFLKRVFNAGDPSINHLIMIPGDGAGVSRTFDGNTNSDFDSLTGLSSVNQIYYALVARQSGQPLAPGDALNIANQVLNNLSVGGSATVQIGPGQTISNVDFGSRIVTQRGDYDLDGHVDGDDFLLWQRALGGAPTFAGGGADGDYDNVIGAGDLSVWTANYGASAAEALLLGSVAEIDEIESPVLAQASPAQVADAIFGAGDLSKLFSPDDGSVGSLRRRFRPRAR